MSKFDDFFEKKKEEAPILDLSKAIINSAEDYRKVLDKIPEFKIRPEKVRDDEIKIRDRAEDQKTKTPKKEIREYEKLGTRGYEEKHYTFMDPIPAEMKGLNFDELCAVNIDWKMLTAIRPKSKLDEEYFSRLVELGKAQLRMRAREKRNEDTWVRRTKNRAGVTETRTLSCVECGEEYCDGKMCAITNYEQFARVRPELAAGVATSAGGAGLTLGATGTRGRKLRRPRTKRKPRSTSAATKKPPPPQQKVKNSRRKGAKSDSEI